MQIHVPPPLPRDRSIGIGCVGAGFIMADCQLVAYRKHGLNPVAICARDVQKAQTVAARHGIANVHANLEQLLANPAVEVVDIAVPPDVQYDVIKQVVQAPRKVRGILAQKPLGMNLTQAQLIVEMCETTGITLAVNQNMRFDQSVRGGKRLLEQKLLGDPVLATIEMRAIPHWMPWQVRLGWVTLRIMSIHHLDTFRYWFGMPRRIFASVRDDPRTSQKFAHADGICMYILEYDDGLRVTALDDVWAGPAREGSAADIGIRWRIEGTHGMARGTIGWPTYPERTPSTLDYTTTAEAVWHQPRWDEVWFPDAFIGPMADLLCALEEHRLPMLNGRDNLKTMALVDACYQSVLEHRAIELSE